jgi:hypothetical protein
MENTPDTGHRHRWQSVGVDVASVITVATILTMVGVLFLELDGVQRVAAVVAEKLKAVADAVDGDVYFAFEGERMAHKGGSIDRPSPNAVNRAVRTLLFSRNAAQRKRGKSVLSRAIPRELFRRVERCAWRAFCAMYGHGDVDRFDVNGRKIHGIFATHEADTALPLAVDAVISTDSDCGARCLSVGARWIFGVQFQRSFVGGRCPLLAEFSASVALKNVNEYVKNVGVHVDDVDVALCVMLCHVLDGSDFVARLRRRSHSEIARQVFQAFEELSQRTVLRDDWVRGTPSEKAHACTSTAALLLGNERLSAYCRRFAPVFDGAVTTSADYAAQVVYYLTESVGRPHADMDVDAVDVPLAVIFGGERNAHGQLRRPGFLRLLCNRGIAAPFVTESDVHEIAAPGNQGTARAVRREQRKLNIVDMTPSSVNAIPSAAAAPRVAPVQQQQEDDLRTVAVFVTGALNGAILDRRGTGNSSGIVLPRSRTRLERALRCLEFSMSPDERVGVCCCCCLLF